MVSFWHRFRPLISEAVNRLGVCRPPVADDHPLRAIAGGHPATPQPNCDPAKLQDHKHLPLFLSLSLVWGETAPRPKLRAPGVAIAERRILPAVRPSGCLPLPPESTRDWQDDHELGLCPTIQATEDENGPKPSKGPGQGAKANEDSVRQQENDYDRLSGQ